jgi:phage terminase large subunit-like protein
VNTTRLPSNDEVVFSFDDELGDKPLVLTEALENDSTNVYDILQTVEGLKDSQMYMGFKRWFVPGSEFSIDNLEKHKAWFEAGATYRERYFSASNRTGKTVSGAYEATVHATGLYPEWWTGKRFNTPTNGWVVGSTTNTTRDICQKELFGPLDAPGTGMIPPHLIGKITVRPNSGGAYDVVTVFHVSGGLSTIGFKSYEMRRESFEGTNQHWVWMDETAPIEIYSECLIRTAMTGGILFMTATPLKGLTPLVLAFFTRADFLPLGSDVPAIVKMTREDSEQAIQDRIAAGEMDILDLKRYRESKGKPTTKAVLVCGWDHAPWLDEDTKRELIESTPTHERAARTTGLPSMGAGSVFSVPLEDIVVPDFEIPAYWKKVCGMDVGWNNTAAVWLAQNPDTDEWFLYSEYKDGKQEPIFHAETVKRRGVWMNVAIDPASKGRSQADGKQLFNTYRGLGLKVFTAANARESSIFELQQAFATGKLKVFKSLQKLQAEYMTYRRAENGKVLKENDHCLVGSTVVHTPEGPVQIRDLVGKTGKVLSLNGEFVPFKNCRLTRKLAPVVEVLFEDGYKLRCTPDHKLLTTAGWIQAIDSLRYDVYTSPVTSQKENTPCNQKSPSCLSPSKSSSACDTISAENISNGTALDCTGLCGSTSTEKSLTATMYITKTTTSPTIAQTISNCWKALLTCLTINGGTGGTSLMRRLKRRLFGTGQKMGQGGTTSTTLSTKTSSIQRWSETVPSAAQSTRQIGSTTTPASAQTNASPPTGEAAESTMLNGTALFAEQSLLSANIQSNGVARFPAEPSLLRVVSVRVLCSPEDVYCMEVPSYHCFAVGNGAIVHNCIDAMRYAWTERKHAKQPPTYVEQQGFNQGGYSQHGARQYDI